MNVVRLLVDEARRILAETLIGWALRTYPTRTPDDVEVARAIAAALKASMYLLLRRAGT